jgi:hypothetical protein
VGKQGGELAHALRGEPRRASARRSS